jgi:hypothetical protein
MKELISSAVFSIILIIVLLKYITYSHIAGFWKAGGSFCEKSDLELFLIYISSFKIYSNTARGYIIMQNKDGFIINTAAEFTLNIIPDISSICSGTFNIKWLDGEKYEFMPAKLEITYFPYVGKIILKKGDTVYGELYKDANMSDLKVADDPKKTLKEEDGEIIGKV